MAPKVCCGNPGSEGCACGPNAKCEGTGGPCTCGKLDAKPTTTTGPRCSCHERAAGECNCDRAATENAAPAGEKCACGVRAADACTCEKASSGTSGLETDFTTKA